MKWLQDLFDTILHTKASLCLNLRIRNSRATTKATAIAF